MQSIIFDQQTLQVLKNFARIRSSIIIREGNVLTTTHENRSVFAHAVLDNVSFPKEFSIYDLNMFLSVMSSFKDDNVELDFSHDGLIMIRGNRGQVNFWMAAKAIHEDLKENIRGELPKKIIETQPAFTFFLEEDELKSIRNMCNTLSLDILEITNSHILAKNKDNQSNNTYKHKIDVDESSPKASALIHVENMNFIPGKYEVNVYNENIPIVWFHNYDMNIDYFLGVYKG